MSVSSSTRKVCFVTVGATANFDLLIRASLSSSFLSHLGTQGYTDLILQHGKDGDKLLRDILPDVTFDTSDPLVDPWAMVQGIRISRFDFRREGLQKEMLAARGASIEYKTPGVVVCHAGKSTLLIVSTC